MLDASKQIAETQEEAKQNADEIGLSWRSAASWSKNFATSIKDATLSLAKWTGITTIATGLVGAGSFFGLDALARDVGAGRRSALGLGLTYGQHKAFNIDLGQVLNNPESFLSGVNEALLDPTKRSLLYKGGLTGADIAGKNTAQVSVELLQSIKNRIANIPDQYLGIMGGVLGYDQLGLGDQDLRLLKNMPQKDVARYLSQFGGDQSAFDLDPKTQEKWQNLSRALDAAESKISSAFIKGLDPLVDELPQLSDAIANAITVFLKSPNLKIWMTDFGNGVLWLSKKIADPKFQGDISTFVTDIGLVAQSLVNGLKWLHVIPGSPQEQSDNAALQKKTEADVARATSHPLLNIPQEVSYIGGKIAASVSANQTNATLRALGASPDDAAAIEGNSEWESGNDPGRWGDKTKSHPKGTAYGLFQFHKTYWTEYAKWAAKTNQADKSIFGSSASEQLAFLMYDITEGKDKAVGARMRAAKTLAEKVAIFNGTGDGRGFENPANPAASYNQRFALASRNFTHTIKSNVKVNVKVTSAPGSNPIVNASTVGAPQ